MSEAVLANIAQQLGMQNYILIGKGEENSGGRSKRAILADATEALIGALYLDGGFAAAHRFVQRLFEPEIAAVLENRHQRDYKTLLQEFVQKRYRTYPRYNVVQKSGPDHDRTFHVEGPDRQARIRRRLGQEQERSGAERGRAGLRRPRGDSQPAEASPAPPPAGRRRRWS